MTSIRVSILGDDPFFRDGVRQLLSSDPSFVVVNHELHTPTAPAVNTADVLLVDSRTDAALQRSAQFEPEQRPFLIFLMVSDDASAIDALAAGARGVVRKSEPLANVAGAIRVVHDGSVWAPRAVLVQAWLRHREGAASVEERLSVRELEVVRSLALGLSNKELAEQLGISMATVKAHLTHVFQKLGLSGRGELIAAYHGTRVAKATTRSTTRLRLPS
jgi:DNA-binding NarL/FixJ family response regulator